MLVILPPSETKVAGGVEGSSLDIESLSFSVQNSLRSELVSELVALAGDESASLAALKLGPKGATEVQRNRELLRSPVIPALQRYTGVLYDALALESLDEGSRQRAHNSLSVFSALFGLVMANDLIPAYRLSSDSSLPGGKPTSRWPVLGDALWGSVSEFVIDLRSGGYRTLSPLPASLGVFVSLVQPGPQGARAAVGHHNKALKGALVRELMTSGAELRSVDELVEWGRAHGYAFDPGSYTGSEIQLVAEV